MGLRLDGDGELQVSREPSRPRYGPSPSLGLRFSGKTGNLRSGDELPSHDVNFVGPGTWSTKPCGGEPCTVWSLYRAKHRDVDAADSRRCLLQRHLQGRSEARVSEVEELTGFGLAYLNRLPKDEC